MGSQAHGIAEHGRFDEALQCGHATGISCGDSLAAGDSTPHLTFRQFSPSRSSSRRLMVERASPGIREPQARREHSPLAFVDFEPTVS